VRTNPLHPAARLTAPHVSTAPRRRGQRGRRRRASPFGCARSLRLLWVAFGLARRQLGLGAGHTLHAPPPRIVTQAAGQPGSPGRRAHAAVAPERQPAGSPSQPRNCAAAAAAVVRRALSPLFSARVARPGDGLASVRPAAGRVRVGGYPPARRRGQTRRARAVWTDRGAAAAAAQEGERGRKRGEMMAIWEGK
jgi:hypothetical protein